MTDSGTIALVAYAAGVLIGLVRTDARPVARLGLAVLWPLGPLAFAVTIVALVGTAAIAAVIRD